MLKRIYLSAKMMKFHPLMTKELRKTYSLMASAALRAMSPEFKYGVKKEFNKMVTALKAMRAKMKAEKALYGPINRRGFFGKVNYWNKLIGMDIGDAHIPEYLAGYEPEIVTHNPNYIPSGPIGTTADYAAYKKLLEDRIEMNRQKCSCLRKMRRIGTRRGLDSGAKEENLLEIISKHLKNGLKQLMIYTTCSIRSKNYI